MFQSLVSLTTSTYKELSWQTIKDLNLAQAFEDLLELSEHQESIILGLCQDIETIQYRQQIMADFVAMPKLLEELHKHLERFGQFRYQVSNELKKASRLYYLIELLKIVEASVFCLEELFQTLCYYNIKSEGLIKLKASVEVMLEASLYKKMKQDMRQIRYIFSSIRSVEVSINMNTGMRPYEAQVTDVNEHKYRFPKAFRKVSDAIDRTDTFLGNHLRSYVPVFPVQKVHLDLLEEIEYALREHYQVLWDFLNSYNKVDSTPFMRLREEITFYLGGMNLIKDLKDNGLPLCWPKISPHSDKKMEVTNAYNLFLARELLANHSIDTLVYNRITFDQKMNQMILTGSNRGGKTTFTQMVGQIQILAQLGFQVPGLNGDISLVDTVLTHFPLQESESVNHGRFGRDCLAFKDAYKVMTEHSIILMNESFAGTSHLESLEVADEVIKALKVKGCRFVYNTHIHELGDRIESYNKIGNPNNRCDSYVVGDITSDRIYEVYASPPRGISQAYEIAKEFGVTYEQLVDRLKEEANG